MGSAVLSPIAVIPVTLSLFGGTDTELNPSDCPEGLSPDNQDMMFFPGETISRYGLSRRYAAQISPGASGLYQKTYIQPNGNPLNLILTSDGKLWVEDVVNNPAPAAPTLVSTVPAGTYAQSVSAFGREYSAFSDLLHGQGIPLQYDGTNLDRVTQDGPAVAPAAGDENVSQAIKAAALGLLLVNTFTVASGSEDGFTVTLNLVGLGPHENSITVSTWIPNDIWRIAGVGAGYNGDFPITSCILTMSGITITYTTNVSGLAAVGAAGTVVIPYYVVANAASSTTLPGVGQQVTIAAATDAAYDGTWQARLTGSPLPASSFTVSIPALFGHANSGGGTWTSAGMISIGTHGVVMMFLTRQGALTAPSPIAYWKSAGSKRVVLGNLAIGPSNVVARVFGFTGAGGANFFTLPTSVSIPQPSAQPIIIAATVLPDNTSSSVTLDFSDNALFDGIAIDQIGNDLFDQKVLGPCLGFFAFASRLIAWGEWNTVTTFRNMAFGGGTLATAPTTPTWWTVDTAGGQQASGGPWASSNVWQITADGTVNPIGRIYQTAYQDSFGDAILAPNQLYTVRMWASANAPTAGNINIDLFSTAGGVLATAQIPITSLTTQGAFVSAALSVATPATIPTDTFLRISEQGGPIGMRCFLTEVSLVFSDNPYKSTASVSYVLNPEGFAQTTGNLGPADDSTPVENFSLQRNIGLLHTQAATHEFQDNGFEPGDGNNAWAVDSLTHSVGAVSLRACDPGQFGTGDAAEDWDIIASKNGLYLHTGATFYKCSQEMSRTIETAPSAVTWDDINWAAQQTIWVKNNVAERYALIGIPVGEATTPNVVLLMDYREMDTVQQIAAATPIHITLQGKMKSSDLTRKWTRWNIAASSAEILVTPGNGRDLFFGGTGFGNLYSLNPAKLTDDDYGQIVPYYVTYAFVDHDAEQALQLGSERHLYKPLKAFITGVGIVTITPIVNTLTNVMPALTPRILVQDADQGTTLAADLQWNSTVRGERVFFRFDVEPLPGTTDVQMHLQKFIAYMQRDGIAPFRQGSL